MTRPRVRTVGDDAEETTLESYATFADTDLLSEQVTARTLAGISTRKYPVALEPVGRAVEQSATSTSKSAVSRRFVTATAERLAELCARPLDQARWPIVMLDGVHLGEHLLVVALGVRKLRAAWANPDPDAAQRELEALARALDKKRAPTPPPRFARASSRR